MPETTPTSSSEALTQHRQHVPQKGREALMPQPDIRRRRRDPEIERHRNEFQQPDRRGPERRRQIADQQDRAGRAQAEPGDVRRLHPGAERALLPRFRHARQPAADGRLVEIGRQRQQQPQHRQQHQIVDREQGRHGEQAGRHGEHDGIAAPAEAPVEHRREEKIGEAGDQRSRGDPGDRRFRDALCRQKLRNGNQGDRAAEADRHIAQPHQPDRRSRSFSGQSKPPGKREIVRLTKAPGTDTPARNSIVHS